METTGSYKHLCVGVDVAEDRTGYRKGCNDVQTRVSVPFVFHLQDLT